MSSMSVQISRSISQIVIMLLTFFVHTLGEQLAVQTCHALQERGDRSPRLGLPVCEGKHLSSIIVARGRLDVHMCAVDS